MNHVPQKNQVRGNCPKKEALKQKNKKNAVFLCGTFSENRLI